MTTTAREPAFAVDVAYAPHRVTAAHPADQRLVAALQLVQRRRAQEAAREARFILQFAALRPDDDDPPPGAPGARSRTRRVSDPEFPGISESFVHELVMVLGVGRGTAAHKLRRALTWRDSSYSTRPGPRRTARPPRPTPTSSASPAPTAAPPWVGAERRRGRRGYDVMNTLAQPAKSDG